MPFDGFVMASAAAELKEKILFSRIIKIYQPEPHLILVRLHRNRENYQLLISAHPVTGRVHLTTQARENPIKAPLFCMVLRKHLEGGRITCIEQEELERVLKIRVEANNELGEKSEKILYVEIMGKHSNIILVDPKENEILDGIRRYTHLVSRYREVLPGRPYLFPPSQGKRNSLETDEDSFRKALISSSLNMKVSNAILKSFSGFSPLLAQDVTARADLPEGALIDDLGEYELVRLWQGFQEVTETAKNNCYHPTIMFKGTELLDFSILPLRQFDDQDMREFPDISMALDFYYSRREYQEVFVSRQRELQKVVRLDRDRLAKKLSLQNNQLAETEDADSFRLYGELITANIYLLSKGMEKASLEDFYNQGSVVEVPLDTRFTPAENAQYYFKKYNKAKSAKVLIEEQMKKVSEELSYLESVLTSLEQAIDMEDLAEIRSELVDSNYLKEKAPSKGKKQQAALSPPLSFTSSDGYTILVGKNNKQNDRLTLKTAMKDDLWLHTKNIPGSHVIVRKKPGEEFPFSTIKEAARLAAYHSKARQSSQVPVDYTLVKQVKKPGGAKPGMVIYFEQKTIFVTPAASLNISTPQDTQ